MRVLVTGGCGFIGSHLVVSLLQAGHDCVVIDDLSNSDPGVLRRVEQIAGARPCLYVGDVRDSNTVGQIMRDHAIEAVVHFAARKHVPESVTDPLGYYDTNIGGLLSVVQAAKVYGVRRLIFSSSGSIYGNATAWPIDESAEHRPTNPYSATKSMGERLLQDLCASDPDWSIAALRYFNPAGAHPSGLLGDDATDIVSNILPLLMRVASGWSDSFMITGDDFDTPDGTGVRDFIHVCDVADGHLAALGQPSPGFRAFNLGRGEGVSVLELIAAVERVAGVSIPTTVQPRRPGDVAALYGKTERARVELGLRTLRSLDEICEDAWRRQQRRTGVANPAA